MRIEGETVRQIHVWIGGSYLHLECPGMLACCKLFVSWMSETRIQFFWQDAC
jgi:hypothetical protein